MMTKRFAQMKGWFVLGSRADPKLVIDAILDAVREAR
jgi:hypothetical protein